VTDFISVIICFWYTVLVPQEAEALPHAPQSLLTAASQPPQPLEQPQSPAHVLVHIAMTATAGITQVKIFRITRTSKKSKEKRKKPSRFALGTRLTPADRRDQNTSSATAERPAAC
jgi:hypothetical protein